VVEARAAMKDDGIDCRPEDRGWSVRLWAITKDEDSAKALAGSLNQVLVDNHDNILEVESR
jgi:hypothetical protein